MNNCAPGIFSMPFRILNPNGVRPVAFKAESVNLTPEEEGLFPSPPAGGIIRIGNLIIGLGGEAGNAPETHLFWLQKDENGTLLSYLEIGRNASDDVYVFTLRKADGTVLFQVKLDDGAALLLGSLGCESINATGNLGGADIYCGGLIHVNGIQVLGPQQPSIGDPDNDPDNLANCCVQILNALRTHGIIAQP